MAEMGRWDPEDTGTALPDGSGVGDKGLKPISPEKKVKIVKFTLFAILCKVKIILERDSKKGKFNNFYFFFR